MIKSFFQAELSIEYLHRPEKDKGETNPFTSNDEKQKHNSFVKSARVEVPEEIVPELIDFLESKGVFMGHIKGLKE